MNRRGFIGALLGTAGAIVLDPERALWKPGKLISIPKAPEIVTLGQWPRMLVKGDIFTIEGIYQVNPITLKKLHLKKFIVTDVDNNTWSVSPA